MQLPIRDGSSVEIDKEFIAELNKVYYGVEDELHKMRLWCLANPERRKTSRGAKRFVFNWINRACKIKPRATPRQEMPTTAVSVESLDVRQSRLAELRGALCK